MTEPQYRWRALIERQYGNDHSAVACVGCESTYGGNNMKCELCGMALDIFHPLTASSRPTVSGNSLVRHQEFLEFDSATCRKMWLGEGGTPCYSLPDMAARLGIRSLHVKYEPANPTGTTKDRAASIAIQWMIQRGIQVYCMASTGNTGASYARVAALVPEAPFCHIFVAKAHSTRIGQVNSLNVLVHEVDGTYADAQTAARRFADSINAHVEGGFFSYLRREGAKLAYLEAIDEMPSQPSAVFQAVSSGLGLVAAHKGFLEYQILGLMEYIPRLFGVQEESCAPMVSAYERRSQLVEDSDIVANPEGVAEAIHLGDPTASYPYVRYVCGSTDGGMISVPTNEIVSTGLSLRRNYEMNVCSASASAVLGVVEAAAKGTVGPRDDILVLAGGSPRPSSTKRP